MRPNRDDALAWEARWTLPSGIAALGAILCLVAAFALSIEVGRAAGDSELLRNVDAHRGAQLASSLVQAIGFGMLGLPLYFLFRAARARSEKMRGELVGLVLAGPLFIALFWLLGGFATLSAASTFVSDDVPRLMADGVGLNSDRADEVAGDALVDVGLARQLTEGLRIAGPLAFVVGMFYTVLHAMRVGLLTRFWGSLGLALAAVAIFFLPFTLLWYVYLGLLLIGWVPGGRPPAWQSGEAEPWPTPGEKASAGDLGTRGDGDNSSAGDPEALPETGEPSGVPGAESGERRKRKQRD